MQNRFVYFSYIKFEIALYTELYTLHLNEDSNNLKLQDKDELIFSKWNYYIVNVGDKISYFSVDVLFRYNIKISDGNKIYFAAKLLLPV